MPVHLRRSPGTMDADPEPVRRGTVGLDDCSRRKFQRPAWVSAGRPMACWKANEVLASLPRPCRDKFRRYGRWHGCDPPGLKWTLRRPLAGSPAALQPHGRPCNIAVRSIRDRGQNHRPMGRLDNSDSKSKTDPRYAQSVRTESYRSRGAGRGHDHARPPSLHAPAPGRTDSRTKPRLRP